MSNFFFATSVATFTTDNLAEGSTNLYFTNERVDDRVAALIQNGTGITWSYNDVGNTLTPTVTITQYTDEMAQDAVGTILTDTTSIDFTYNDAGNIISAVVLPAGVDHNSLANLATADPHTLYALLAGRSGNQILIGGTGASGTLTLQSTSHATKGKILFGTSAYDEVNNRLGIGTASPSEAIEVSGNLLIQSLAGNALIMNKASGGYSVITARIAGSDQYYVNVNASEPIFDIGNGIGQKLFAIDFTTKIVSILGYLDLSAISAGGPNLKITATSDTPATAWNVVGTANATNAPAGFIEILVGANTRYIPFFT